MLGKDFFACDGLELAKSLLGQVLVHESGDGVTKGMIVETECYLGPEDPASHGYRKKTHRNRAMFGPGGHAYIYFSYGIHYCFNITADPDGQSSAVLIRALQPLDGIEIMQDRRKKDDIRALSNGPAKLVQAMGIHKGHYGHHLTQKPLFLEKGKEISKIGQSERIGISQGKHLPYRFYVEGSPFLSR